MASQMAKFTSGRSPLRSTAGAILIALLCTFLLSWIPTQWFAATMHYDKGLGEPLWVGAKFALYFPTDWVEWGWRLGDYEPLKNAVRVMAILGACSASVGMGSAYWFIHVLKRKPKGMDELHGSAHWANVEEMDSTGFFPTKGRPVKGVMIGSVMLDEAGAVVHPMHPLFSERYRKMMGWQNPKLTIAFQKVGVVKDNGGARMPPWMARMLGAAQLRDKDNVPRFELNKIVKCVEFLRADDPTHILGFAPTRSGKGVGLVLPTLLTWQHSVLVNDIKGENWALTAGFRQRVGQKVIKFEPACMDGSTARWNCLDEIRTFTKMDVQDAQGMMMMVCDPKGEGLEDHWAKTSWDFLTGLALHLAYVGEGAGNMAGMGTYLSDPKWDDEKQMYTTMLNAVHDPDGKAGWVDTEGHPTRTHPEVAKAAKTMLNKEDKERGSVLSTAKSFLTLYGDPVVAQNTACSDFCVRDLMNSDQAVSLYFVVQPSDLERMVALSRLFYAMVIRRNATDMKFAGGTSVQGYKHRLLMLIDELPSLRKLSVLQEGLAYIAGYGIKCFLICQDLIQLEDAYGDKQTIVAGCHTQIAYAPNTQQTADMLASMTGKTTIIEDSESKSQDSWGWKTGSVSVSTNKTERDLMTASEFKALSPEDMVLFVAGRPPIYGRKIRYYEDAVMLGRAKIPAPEKSDVIRVAVTAAAAEAQKESAAVDATVKAAMDAAAANRARWQMGVTAVVEGATAEDSDVKAAVKVPSGAAVGGAPGGKRRSQYADRAPEVTDKDREQIKAIVDSVGASVVERVAAFTVF